MRILRIALLILFLITSAVFGVDRFYSYRDRDNTAPVFSSNSDEIILSVRDSESELLKGISATDDRDGDVTSTIVVAGKSNFIDDGVIRVSYAAFDSHNNVGSYSRRVTYTDYRSPRFSSSKPLVLRSGSTYDYSFLQAEDVLCGDISPKIKMMTSFDDTAPECTVNLEVTNDYGDISKLELILDVYGTAEYNRMHPALTEYIIYVPVGEEIDLSSYLAGIWQGDKVLTFEEAEIDPARIYMDDDLVNYDEPGVYSAFFYLPIDRNTTTETRLLVIVTEDY
ncbi:MAG: hypothetical protein IKF46_04805 [Erysipelotrichaceae bacterium]|nr:hypothetical protein [Erysipelotrichaceae bacterium]